MLRLSILRETMRPSGHPLRSGLAGTRLLFSAWPPPRLPPTLFSSTEAVSWYRLPTPLPVIAGLVPPLSGLVEFGLGIARAWDTSVRGIPCPAAAPPPGPAGRPLPPRGRGKERAGRTGNLAPTSFAVSTFSVRERSRPPHGLSDGLAPSPLKRERVGQQGRGEGPWHGRSSCQFSGMARETWWSKRSFLPLPDQVGDGSRGGGQAEHQSPVHAEPDSSGGPPDR